MSLLIIVISIVGTRPLYLATSSSRLLCSFMLWGSSQSEVSCSRVWTSHFTSSRLASTPWQISCKILSKVIFQYKHLETYLKVTPFFFEFIKRANFSSNAVNTLVHRIHPLNNFIEPESCIFVINANLIQVQHSLRVIFLPLGWNLL